MVKKLELLQAWCKIVYIRSFEWPSQGVVERTMLNLERHQDSIKHDVYDFLLVAHASCNNQASGDTPQKGSQDFIFIPISRVFKDNPSSRYQE